MTEWFGVAFIVLSAGTFLFSFGCWAISVRCWAISVRNEARAVRTESTVALQREAEAVVRLLALGAWQRYAASSGVAVRPDAIIVWAYGRGPLPVYGDRP